MGSDSLENISGLQSLEAENKHLKSMLNRFVSSKKEVEVDSASILMSQITSILQDANDFDLALQTCLKLIGEEYKVDRVSVFSYHEKQSSFIAQKQWVDSHVQEYHPADLTITEIENPLETANFEQCFASSDLKSELAASLADKFEIFNTQSLLVIPIVFSHYKRAMLVIESCAFKREWYDFEVKEIERVVGLMSARLDSLWHKSNAARVWYLSSLRNQILRKIKGSKRTKKSINELLRLVGSELGLRSVYVIEKTSYSNGHELSWTFNDEHEEELLSNKDIEKLGLNPDDFNGRYFGEEHLRKCNVDILPGTSFVLVNRVMVSKDFGGWLLGEFASYKKYNPNELIQFWESIALAISEILGGTERELEHNARYSELLEQNRDLITKEIFFDKVLDESPLGTIIVSKGKIKYVNEHIVNAVGYSKEELIGKEPSEFYDNPSDDFKKRMSAFFQAIKEHGAAKEDIELGSKDGELKHLSLYGSRGLEASEDSYLIFAQDNTETYLAQENIRESRERYQKIVESAIDGAMIIDEEHGIKYVNKSACIILGRSSDELSGIRAMEVVDKAFLHEFAYAIDQVEKGEEFLGDLVLCKKDGEKIEIELAGTQIFMDNKSHCYFTLHDISKRKRNERALAESEKEFRTLTQNSPDIILRLNRKGEVLFFNQAFIKRFKFLNPEDIIGKTLLELEVLDEVVEPTWQTKVNDVFITGETMSVEQGFSDEVKELYFDWRLTPETDEEGKVNTLLALGRNLTIRKTTEKELLLAKEKAEESDKLKSEFLANISHELRTPLNAIVGFSGLLRGANTPQSELDEYVDVIHKNSDSLMSLINNIIDVAKIESGKISVVKENINLDELMQSLYETFLPKVEIEHKGRVKLYYTKPENIEGLKVNTDPIRLRQILVNLIGNAIKFTIKGFVEFGFSLEGNNLKFFVKDTGIGIKDAKQAVIFQPFSKGQEESDKIYGGTGIGLAICEKLVHALGGEIGLTSEKAKGSEFFFTHPQNEDVSRPRVMTSQVKMDNPIVPKKYSWVNKMMLLVDENSSAHLQMRKYIEKTGITLVSARTAAGASKLLMNRTDIDLVLMDMTFPDSDGYELVKAIKKVNQELPVIAHTARAVNGERERLIEGGFDACIAKPAEKEELLMLMDQYLVEA